MKKLGVFFVFLLVGILLINFVSASCANPCNFPSYLDIGDCGFVSKCSACGGNCWDSNDFDGLGACYASGVFVGKGGNSVTCPAGCLAGADHWCNTCGDGYCDGSSDCTLDCCVPSLTVINYSGQCGVGFSNGCNNSVIVTCPSNYYCNVSSGQGICLSNFSISKPYFSTLTAPNVTISSANVGDTVLMRFPGQSLNNKIINYSVSIYNSSGAVWWNPFSYFSKDWDSSQKLIGTAYEPFVLTQTELHKINASIVGTNQWNSSENLSVSSSTSNALPTAIITSPASDSKAQVGSLVEFNQSSTDEDDLLNITWNFGDGNITSCLNYSFGLDSAKCNIQHAYTNKGIYLVKLTAKEMNRAQSSQQMMLIYVFDSGVNVVPVISSPRFGISYGNFVDFNASGSYVANCSTSMSNSDFPVGNLNCSYLHISNKPSTQNLVGYNLTFSWNMDGSSLVGNWSSYDSVVLFKYYFVNSGAHNSKLNLTYTTL